MVYYNESDELKKYELIDNVTVVWTANHPTNGGTFIVGWYLNARVYRYEQSAPKNSNREYNKNTLGFYTTTKISNAKLLSVDERVVQIRRREKNWMGQSIVWYADNNLDFISLLKNIFLKVLI